MIQQIECYVAAIASIVDVRDSQGVCWAENIHSNASYQKYLARAALIGKVFKSAKSNKLLEFKTQRAELLLFLIRPHH